MDKSSMIAYTEVEAILNLMDEKYRKKIPQNMLKLISENKLGDYDVNIDPQIPLNHQNLSKKTLEILAVINYKYWCEDENKKQELMEKYRDNEKKQQEKLRQLYNPDTIFENKKTEKLQNEEDTQLIIYNKKDSLITKIFSKIKKILKLT